MVTEMDNRLSDIKDSERYRWLRLKFSMGEETYIGEWMTSEDELDKYIDEQIIKEQQKEITRGIGEKNRVGQTILTLEVI